MNDVVYVRNLLLIPLQLKPSPEMHSQHEIRLKFKCWIESLNIFSDFFSLMAIE